MSKILNVVKRTVYKKLKQAELGTYVDMLLEKAKGSVFEPFQAILTDLEKKKNDYEIALAKVEYGGRPATIIKDAAKKLLQNQLDVYANGIDTAAITNPLIIPQSGFTNKTSNNAKPPTAKLPPPTYVKVTPSADIPGRVTVEIAVEDPKSSWTYTTEWAGKDEIWTIAKVGSAKKFVHDGLPSGTMIKMRTMISSSNGYSDYTESVYVYVV